MVVKHCMVFTLMYQLWQTIVSNYQLPIGDVPFFNPRFLTAIKVVPKLKLDKYQYFVSNSCSFPWTDKNMLAFNF
jgi:hypothetical protein